MMGYSLTRILPIFSCTKAKIVNFLAACYAVLLIDPIIKDNDDRAYEKLHLLTFPTLIERITNYADASSVALPHWCSDMNAVTLYVTTLLRSSG
jgi:hypothetical protein